MSEKEKQQEEEPLKVLRVRESFHQIAKALAARRGVKLQLYIEALIQADESNLLLWDEEAFTFIEPPLEDETNKPEKDIK